MDHVLGLFRLWWVPDGAEPADGTYVRYDHEALVGILALEAHRAGAVVVGEDLGTVEPWMRDALRERGILGTSVLWFERVALAGEPLAPEHWRRTVPGDRDDARPAADRRAICRGEHLRIRARARAAGPARGRGARRRPPLDQEAWQSALRARGLLREGADERETVEALHRYVASTPARLLGVALTDAVGDVRAQNQPGTSTQYPNWQLPLSDAAGRPVLLEDVVASERVRSLARSVRAG